MKQFFILLITFFTIVSSIFSQPGTPDLTFGDSGKVITPFPGECNAAALQRDGKIIVGGSGNGATLVRYLSDGSLDATFGEGGFSIITDPALSGFIYDIAILMMTKLWHLV